MRAKEIEVGMGLAYAIRVTYLGELGWELHVPSDQAVGVYDALFAAGADLGIGHAGLLPSTRSVWRRRIATTGSTSTTATR